jgi:hypothetical protein
MFFYSRISFRSRIFIDSSHNIIYPFVITAVKTHKISIEKFLVDVIGFRQGGHPFLPCLRR